MANEKNVAGGTLRRCGTRRSSIGAIVVVARQCVAGIAVCTLLIAIASRASSASEVVPIDGEPFNGKLAGVLPDGQINFRTGEGDRTLPMADLFRWGVCPEQGRAGGLLTTDGGWIAARILSADGKRLSAESDALGWFSLPLDAIAAVVFDSAVHLPLEDGPATKMLLQNGDELTGSLLSIFDRTARLQTDLGDVEIPTDRVAAIILASAARSRPDAAKIDELAGRPRVWIGLGDGSRLLAERLDVADSSATFAAVGRQWKTAAQDVVFLQPIGGRVTYLSDVRPTEYHQMPYLGPRWPWRADRNATGGRLRAGGRTYLKGLGMHGAARLVYSPLLSIGLDGNETTAATRRFRALAAIDDSTGRHGSVRFRVLVDGREKYASPIVRGGDPPMPVDVDLTGAERLELVVDYADRADLLDRADWLDARIVSPVAP